MQLGDLQGAAKGEIVFNTDTASNIASFVLYDR